MLISIFRRTMLANALLRHAVRRFPGVLSQVINKNPAVFLGSLSVGSAKPLGVQHLSSNNQMLIAKPNGSITRRSSTQISKWFFEWFDLGTVRWGLVDRKFGFLDKTWMWTGTGCLDRYFGLFCRSDRVLGPWVLWSVGRTFWTLGLDRIALLDGWSIWPWSQILDVFFYNTSVLFQAILRQVLHVVITSNA